MRGRPWYTCADMGRKAVKAVLMALLLGGMAYGARVALRKPPARVRVYRVERRSLVQTVAPVSTGVIEPAKRVNLVPQVSGLIERVLVKRGEHVEKGQVLIELDDSDVQRRLVAARVALSLARVRVRQAELRLRKLEQDLDRARRLLSSGGLAGHRVRDAEFAVQGARLQVQAARLGLRKTQIEVKNLEAQLEKTRIRAPFDGTVMKVGAREGEYAGVASPTQFPLQQLAGGESNAGSSAARIARLAAPPAVGQVLLQLADTRSFHLVVEVDERDLPKVRVGQKARVQVDALGGREIRARVEEIYPYVAHTGEFNRVAMVRLALPGTPGLKPGMSASVEIEVGHLPDVLAVPAEAVITEGTEARKKVYRVVGSELHETEVDVGAMTWEWAVILRGLSVGELVAVPSGSVKFVDGMRVLPVRDVRTRD